MRLSMIDLNNKGIVPENINTEPAFKDPFSKQITRISNQNKKLRKLGARFRFKKTGHISKDCPLTPWNKQISSKDPNSENKKMVHCLELEEIHSKKKENIGITSNSNKVCINLLEEIPFKEIEAVIEDCEMELGAKE
ncbi:hypothetical protein BB560_006513 [Smittium megazygosporum]|uniref:Uncharacterized protein n=1 Tax=Smittium megazygosporum TaxID=133381 RepID=A0A2T9Y4P0_9FUNG|nr:hypothetical protein BB560_006513 [Smittium megazygosporum]